MMYGNTVQIAYGLVLQASTGVSQTQSASSSSEASAPMPVPIQADARSGLWGLVDLEASDLPKFSTSSENANWVRPHIP